MEPDEYYDAARNLAGDLPDNVHLVQREDLTGALNTVDLRHHMFRQSVFLVPALCATREHPAYVPLLQYLRDRLELARFEVNIRFQGAGFIVRRLENLPDHEYPLSALEDVFRGREAVVLGGGPSLDELLPWVRAHRDKLAVLAVSRISKRLLAEQLLPDFVFTIDPQQVSFEVSKEMLRFPADRALVYETHAHPGLVAMWPGRSFYTGPRRPWEVREEVPYGPTVGHLAVWAATLMGFRTIYLAGIDLCYGPRGKAHESVSGAAEGAAVRRDVRVVETNRGDEAETDLPFLTGISSLARLAAIASAKGTRLINLAGSAAVVPGVEFVEPAEITPAGERFDAAASLARRCPPLDTGQRRTRLEQCKGEIQGYLEECARIRRRVSAASRLIREIDKTPEPKRAKKVRELKRHTTRIQQKHGPFLDVVQKAFPDLFYAHFDTKTRLSDLAARLRHDKMLLRAYEATLPRLEGLLRRVLDKAQLRIDELDPAGREDHLADQWIRGGEPLRYQGLPDGVRERFWENLSPASRDRLRRAADRIFEEKATRTGGFEPETALGKLQDAFRRGDAAALRRAGDTFSEHTVPEAAELRTLAQAFAAELEGRPDEALARYRELSPPTWAPLQKVVSPRMAKLLLAGGRPREAADLLYPLCTEGGPQAPDLARAIIRAGNPALALRAVVELLQTNPDDPALWCVAGEAQEALGEPHGACEAYRQALTHAPGHARAAEALRGLEQNQKDTSAR